MASILVVLLAVSTPSAVSLQLHSSSDTQGASSCSAKLIKESAWCGELEDTNTIAKDAASPEACADLAHKEGARYFMSGTFFLRGTCIKATFDSPEYVDVTNKDDPSCTIGDGWHSSMFYDFYEVTCESPSAAATPECTTGTCTVSEDPHIEIFDGGHISLLGGYKKSYTDYQTGDWWLVKTPSVSIQARYALDATLNDRNLFVRAVAVGGDFVKGNTLVIGSLEDESTWNRMPILASETSEFELMNESVGFHMRAERTYNSSLVEDLSIRNHGINLELPLGMSMVVNRLQHHINVAITMCKSVQEHQDGLCGNFNGLAFDDSLEFQSQRFDARVPAGESFFTDLGFD